MKIEIPSWYEQVIESRKFLDEFIFQVESQIALSISKYQAEKESAFEEGYYYEHYKGFDDYTYDVKDLFTVYFPNLSRRSALINIYSFLEIELNKLCIELKEKKNETLHLKDLTGDGIVRASNYFIKVIKLPWDNSKGIWSEIRIIQNLRNKIVHSDGKIDSQNKDNDSLITYIVKSNYLVGTKGKEKLVSNIILKEGFLNYLLDKIYELFDEINSSIQKH